MTIQQLDQKYEFSRTKTAADSGMSYPAVIKFFQGAPATVKTAAAIINALPITPIERAALIETMFQPKGEEAAANAQP